MPLPLIQCSGLTYGYHAEALTSPLSFSVEPEDYLCIVGENGTGKSTLMRTMLGLHPVISGTVVTDESVKRGIGYLPQQTDIQRNFPASVTEIVLSGCQSRLGYHPFYRRCDRELAAHCLQRTGMSDYAARTYNELSGGQQQRVLLARALCAAERILFLDEPTASLDPNARESMYDLIRSLNQEDGLTIVMVTHDLRGALRDARHILRLGASVFYGSVEEYRISQNRSFAELLNGGDWNE